ncbi:MAG: prepilin-type N-terminal cleavage/methylation domain-containing protein [Deltaproteobacteria bacterium]|nr:prepilin-type N-terminal cleavage/methylation domain-containing protein [Deltaproteobacteria bacterium]
MRPEILKSNRLNKIARTGSPGFTLLELIVVIAVIGTILAIVFPRISNVGERRLHSDSARVSSLLVYLSEAATTKKVYYRARFDLDKELIRIESSKDGEEYAEETEGAFKGITLSDGVSIEDVVLSGLGRVNTGEVAVVMQPFGNAEPFVIHFKGGDDFLTLSFNPYTGRSSIEEGYV